jgi:MSHA biogenesis protein MshQ
MNFSTSMKVTHFIFLSIFMLLLFFSSSVFSATYSVQTTTYAWDTATTDVVWDQTSTSYPKDDDKQVVNIGFTFPFAGVNYTQVRILTNGILQFGADQNFHQVFTNAVLPAATGDRLIIPYWDDLNPGGTVRYSTLGSAPNRRFVVAWEGVPAYPSTGSYTFQVAIYENGNFTFQYGVGNADGASATIGVEVDDTDFTQYSFNTVAVAAGTALLFTAQAATASYGMEQTAWSGAGSVTDDIGAFNGSPLGSAVPLLPSAATPPNTCRAMSVPVNTTTTTDAINTGIDVNTSIGNRGTISFWYRHRAVWNDGTLRMLFDASRNGGASDATDKNFYLVKQTDGSLRFALEDSADKKTVALTPAQTFAANSWVHVAVQWDFPASRVRIFLNGVLQATSSTAVNGTLGDTDTLYIGDARNDIANMSGTTNYTNNSANGEIDEVRIYNYARSPDSNFSRPCPTLNDYSIAHSGTGITCAAEPITISARNASGLAFIPSAGTIVTLTPNAAPTTWAGGNTYTFTGTESSFVKYLQRVTPGTININLIDNNSKIESPSFDPSITFVDTALKFYGSTGLIAMPNQVASVVDNAPVLKAIRTDTLTGACVAQVTGVKSTRLAYECRNPTSCVAGQVLNVNGTAIQSNANAAAIVYSSQNLTFDATGTASIPFSYTDVGQVKLHAQLALPASGSDPAITLSGSSNDFVVRPYTLAVSSVLTAAGGANPGGTSASGAAAGFVSAGTTFQVKVEARNSAGNRTPNFGNETVSENNITLTPQSLVYPAGGTLTAISGATGFSATTPTGTFLNSSVAWNQVGSITLRPTLADNDYLAAGNISAFTDSGTIGRFYPDHFALISSSTANSCGTFSYMSQPAVSMSYLVQAQSLTNTVLTNYGTTYGTQATPSYVAENADGANGAILSPRVVATASASWVSGEMNFSSVLNSINRQSVNSAPDGPFASLRLGLDLVDTFDARSLQGKNMNASTSGACSAGCSAITLGGLLNLRYGRLRLDDAFGPETVKLPVNFVTEYWTGNYFALNASDSCTLVPRAAVTYLKGGLGGTLATDANRTVALSSGTTTGMYVGLNAVGIPFSAGSVDHYFSTPTAAGMGEFTVGIDLSTLTWLRYDWNQDGNYADTLIPPAHFSFGSYRGNDRIIYWREKLQ